MFVGVITNLMFAAMVAVAALRSGTIRLTVWGIQIGLAGFAVGLITESPVLKRISTPIMGLALLLGIVLLLGALRSDRASRPALETA
jgi:hypothetical protein